jgi:hypothetical protein
MTLKRKEHSKEPKEPDYEEDKDQLEEEQEEKTRELDKLTMIYRHETSSWPVYK